MINYTMIAELLSRVNPMNNMQNAMTSVKGIGDYIQGNAYAEPLSPNFSREEFNQRNAPLPIQDVKVDQRLIDTLETFRSLLGNKKIKISSGYRTPEYNSTLKGSSPISQHLYGRAADLKVKGMSPSEVNAKAIESGLFGYVEPQELTPTWTHTDIRMSTPDKSSIQNIPYPSNYSMGLNAINLAQGKNFIQRLNSPEKYPVINNEDGTISTHKMASGEYNDKGVVFPTIIYDNKKKELKEMSAEEAFRYAIQTGEYLEFPNTKQALWFSQNYKKYFPKMQE